MTEISQRLHFKYILYTFFAVLFTWLLHEFSHWLVGEILGNSMAMSLNGSYPESGKYINDWHKHIVSAAGPVITIIQAFICYYLLKSRKTLLLFPFLLTCLYMRTLAGGLNFINLNDEGRLSNDFGLGTFTLSILVIGVLFYLVYAIVKMRLISTRLIVSTVLLIMLFSSILILADQFLKIRLL